MSNSKSILPSAEDLINNMVDIMPFVLPESIRPYIKEALDVHAKQCIEKALDIAAKEAKTDGGGDFPNEINRSYIRNLVNDPRLKP